MFKTRSLISLLPYASNAGLTDLKLHSHTCSKQSLFHRCYVNSCRILVGLPKHYSLVDLMTMSISQSRYYLGVLSVDSCRYIVGDYNLKVKKQSYETRLGKVFKLDTHRTFILMSKNVKLCKYNMIHFYSFERILYIISDKKRHRVQHH